MTEFFAHSLVIIGSQSSTESLVDGNAEKMQVAENEPVLVISPKDTNKQPLPKMPLPTAEKGSELVWLGNFAKKVLVLVKDTDAVHLSEAELDLLAKVLMAVKLSLNDVAIINRSRHAQSLDELRQTLPASQVLLFGVDAAETGLPMRFPNFQITRWNGCAYLAAPSLREINQPGPEQKAWKTGLWNGLKEMFQS